MKHLPLVKPAEPKEIPDIGIALRKLRLSRDFTQQQVADSLGISRNSYIAWENNKVNVSVQHCLTLCQVYGIKVSQFFTDYVECSESIYRRRSA